MIGLAARLLALFIDDAWLAGIALGWVAGCAATMRLGLSAQAGAWLLVLGLCAGLALNVLAAAKAK